MRLQRKASLLCALGIASISAVQLGFELLFIKLSHYEFGTLSLGVIGLAILGVALAGPGARLLGGGAKAAARSTGVLAPVATLVGCLMFSLEHRWTGESDAYLRIGLCGTACLTVLALSAIPVFVGMQSKSQSVFVCYSASLAGATFGVPLAFALMHWLGDDGAFAGMLALCVPAAALLGSGRSRIAGVGLALGCAALAVPLLPHLSRQAHAGAIFSKTNGFSRIDVYPRDDGTLRFSTAGINAGTSTPRPEIEGSPSAARRLLAARAFWLAPERVLILGAGGGKDVANALASGAQYVTAVEINGMIPEYMEQRLSADRNPYRDPRVDLVVAEGRESAAQLSAERARHGGYDLVYVPTATLFGASGQAFTQTYLMTREALSLYARLLRPGGLVAVYSPLALQAKVARAMAKALAAAGVSDPESHMQAIHSDQRFLLVARPDAPFSHRDGAALRGSSPGLRFTPLRELLSGAPGQHLLSDDNPFLYNDILSARGRRMAYGWNLGFLHAAFLGCVALLVGVVAWAMVAKTALRRHRQGGFLLAFATLGIAFTVFQTVAIQRLAFLVGHPFLATVVVLPCTLLGTAMGAILSERLRGVASPRGRLAIGAALLTGFACFAVVRPDAFLLASWPGWSRLLLAGAISLATFVLMGTYFPTVFARAKTQEPRLLATGWMLNGVGAVLGSVLAIYGPMMFGFRTMFFVAGGLYLATSLWDAAARRPERWAVADLGLAIVFVGVLGGFAWSLEAQVSLLG